MSRSPICTAGVFIKDGKILLGLRSYESQQWMKIDVWTTPGGRCDEGEEIELTLRREVEEEVGFKDLKIKKELGIVPGAKEGDEVHVFLCESDEKERLMEPHKFKEWKWFDTKDIPENFINPGILKLIKGLK